MKRLFQFSRRSRNQISRDVSAELRFHREARVESLIASGVLPADAYRQAVTEFGDVASATRDLQVIDHANELRHRRSDFMGALRQDIGYSIRTLKSSPTFTLAVIATLALGIGANVAIFSVVNAVLLKPLPFTDADRIVSFAQASPLHNVSEPEFVDYQRDMNEMSGLSAYSVNEVDLTTSEEPQHVSVAKVSNGFFRILGTTPLLGRAFTADEDRRGAPGVIILSHGLWQRNYGSDPGIVGKELLLNGAQVQVIGVMPPAFDFPEHDVAAWLPLRLNPDSLWTRNNHYLTLVGRLSPGASVDGAMVHAGAIDHRWMQDYPQFYRAATPPHPEIHPIRDDYVHAARPYLLALLGAVACVLLIACTNVANLLLARGEARRREFAVRTALGATTRRLVMQLLTESAILSAAGGALGLALAWLGERALIALAPDNIPRLDQVSIDQSALAFTLLVSMVAAILFGLLPAMRAGTTQPASALSAGRSAGAAMVRGARRTLVIAEVVLAVVLLGDAVLLMRSLRNLQAVDLGFNPTRLLTMQLSPPTRSYSDTTAVQLYRTLQDRVGALPGVARVAAMGSTPIADGGSDWSIAIDGLMAAQVSGAPSATPEQVLPGYFSTMGIGMVAGREFNATDARNAPLVVIVNETMAKSFWPGQPAVGHTIKMYLPAAPLATVVGVVRDVRSRGIQADAPPTMYFPHAQAGKSAYYTPVAMTLAIRTAGDPAAITASVRSAIHSIDRNIAISNVRTMGEVIDGSIASRRFGTALLVTFALLALVLAAVGIYGVVAYGVSRRSNEIGIRMALGSSRTRVVGLIMGEAVRTAAIGAVAGIAGAVAIAQTMRSLLVGVAPFDLLAFGGVAAVLLAVVAVAALIPARRASAVDPVAALRE